MAPPHTMSPPKRPPRPGPSTKPAKHRSITTARLSMSSYFQPSQSTMPTSTMPTTPSVTAKEKIINQFRLHREKNSRQLPASMPDDNESQQRISYTKEQKLAAVSYAQTT